MQVLSSLGTIVTTWIGMHFGLTLVHAREEELGECSDRGRCLPCVNHTRVERCTMFLNQSTNSIAVVCVCVCVCVCVNANAKLPLPLCGTHPPSEDPEAADVQQRGWRPRTRAMGSVVPVLCCQSLFLVIFGCLIDLWWAMNKQLCVFHRPDTHCVCGP
jgi:hypothetical protein